MTEEGVHGETFNSKPFKASMNVNSKHGFQGSGFDMQLRCVQCDLLFYMIVAALSDSGSWGRGEESGKK